MKGCKHNAIRKIIYPEQITIIDRRGPRLSFECGQEILLICPKGCSPISIAVSTGKRGVQ